jgi:hypothetical protein
LFHHLFIAPICYFSFSFFFFFKGRKLFEACIIGRLRAKGKTVVLVTNQLSLLSEVDDVIVIDNGVMAEHGTCEELRRHVNTFMLYAFLNNDDCCCYYYYFILFETRSYVYIFSISSTLVFSPHIYAHRKISYIPSTCTYM